MSTNPYTIGTIIDKEYEINALLGEGSFSSVFKVWSKHRKKYYVLKVILPEDSQKDAQGPFKIELDALDEIRRLGTHPHIVSLEQWGHLHDTDALFVLLEYIDGETVTKKVQNSNALPRMNVVEIQQIIMQLLDALQFMHKRSTPIIHRDIKPNNLMLSPSRGLVVIDFNVSKVVTKDGESTTFVGTPPYIPPEIHKRLGKWIPASDLYAVGILIYYLLTGEEEPFPSQTARIFGEAEPADPKVRIPALPDSIVSTMMKAIAYEPTERYQDAEEMKKDVENWFPANIEELIQRVQALRDRMVDGLQTQLADGDRATLEDALKDLEQILAAPEAYDPEHDLLDDIEAITEEILEPQGDDIILDGDAFPHEKYEPEPPENEPEPELEEELVVDKIRGKLNQIRDPRDAGDFDVAREALETLRQEARSDAEALALLEGEEAEIQTAQNMAFGKLIENARNAIKQNHFNEAEKALEEARKLDPHSNELKKLASEINIGKNAHLDSLAKRIREKLAEETDSSLEEKELKAALDKVALLIDEYEQKGTPPDAARKVQEWRKQLNQIQKTSEIENDVKVVRKRCSELFSQGGITNAHEARELIRDLEKNYGDLPSIVRLREDFEPQYENIRELVGEELTSAATAKFRDLIEQYRQKAEKGIKYVSRFTPFRDEDGKLIINRSEKGELIEHDKLDFDLIFVQSRRVLTFSFKLGRFQLRKNAPNSTFPNKITGRSNFSFDLAV